MNFPPSYKGWNSLQVHRIVSYLHQSKHELELHANSCFTLIFPKKCVFTWPVMSFMFMAFFIPLPFSFLFFFFLQQHFLQMQKQQVRISNPATTAMAIRAHGGTATKAAPSDHPKAFLGGREEYNYRQCCRSSGGKQRQFCSGLHLTDPVFIYWRS